MFFSFYADLRVALIFSFSSAYLPAAHNLAVDPPRWLIMYVCINY